MSDKVQSLPHHCQTVQQEIVNTELVINTLESSHQVTLGWALGCLLEISLGPLYFLVKYRVVVSMYRLNNPVPLTETLLRSSCEVQLFRDKRDRTYHNSNFVLDIKV